MDLFNSIYKQLTDYQIYAWLDNLGELLGNFSKKNYFTIGNSSANLPSTS